MTAMRRFAAFCVAAATLAPSAAAAIDPTASALLAGALKPAMQKQVKAKVPGILFTTVRCRVPAGSKTVAGPCTAAFTVAKYRLDGVYQVQASLSSTARLGWHTTSVKCTDARTHKPVAC
jgi:hypothetical protein